MVKVKWTESKYVDYAGEQGFVDTEYSGKIIDTSYNFFIGTTIIVMCTDGKVRAVDSSRVEEVKGKDLG